MNILYTRKSTLEQNSDRQKVNAKDYDMIVEDACSGDVAFMDREGGKKIIKHVEKGRLKLLAVHEIDRLGRDLRDILNTLHYFTQHKVPVLFINQGLKTIDSDGSENAITKLIISVLGIVGEMELKKIRERQAEGIAVARALGKFTGRKLGSREDTLKFLSKPKNKKALTLLKDGYKATEVAKIVGVHQNTLTKIKRLGLG